MPKTNGVALTGARSTPGAELIGFAPVPTNGNPATEVRESVDEAYRRLVLNAPSLLPRCCDMPVARMLFVEWWAERRAQNE